MAHQGARLTVSDGLYSLGGAGKPGINVIPTYFRNVIPALPHASLHVERSCWLGAAAFADAWR
jgi:hypothetical protein